MDCFSTNVVDCALDLFNFHDGENLSTSFHHVGDPIDISIEAENSTFKPDQNVAKHPAEHSTKAVKGPDPLQVDNILSELTQTSDSVIEAEDISSLLDMFLEYEQQAIMEPQDLFLTPATSPGREVKHIHNSLEVDIMAGAGLTPPDTPPPRILHFPSTEILEMGELGSEPEEESSCNAKMEIDTESKTNNSPNKGQLQIEHNYALNDSLNNESTSQTPTKHLESSEYTSKNNLSGKRKHEEERERSSKSKVACNYSKISNQENNSYERHCKDDRGRSRGRNSDSYNRKRRRSSCSDDEDIQKFRRMVYGAQDSDASQCASDESDTESRYNPRKGERNDFDRKKCDQNNSDDDDDELNKYERLKKHAYYKEKKQKKKEEELKERDVERQRKLLFKFGYFKPKDVAKEERRVVYVGGFTDDTTKDSIRRRFRKFGPIEDVKLHFRDVGDNYGFLTFFESKDAVQAIDRGNRDRSKPQLDLCFGGRREYVGGSYVDFDSNANCSDTLLEERPSRSPSPEPENDFDALLKMSLVESKKKKNSQWT